MNIYTPSLNEFLKLSQQGNVIPVYKEINADLDTPVSAYLKLKKTPYSFLLESVEGQERIARYSFLGTDPLLVFKSKGSQIEVFYPREKVTRRFKSSSDPLDELKKIMLPFKTVVVKGLPRFYGGLVGYIGYEMVRFFEDIPQKNPDDLKLPAAFFVLADTILVFDHLNHTIKIVTNAILPQKGRLSTAQKKKIYQQAVSHIERYHSQLNKPNLIQAKRSLPAKARLSSNFSKGSFSQAVRRAKGYIKEGEVIQVVLSQRFQLDIQTNPLDIYRNLRSLNPSPYMFFLDLKEVVLVGSSPEIHVRCEQGVVQIRPIAGTRPRGKTEQQDQLLEAELLADVKEKAEHLMLVDLARNDLGRVCKTGSIKLKEFMLVERYSHVMHLVSDVEGILDKKYDIYDCLRASFPAGTVSGSPKVRAMEIIDELENLERSAYAGCLGYFSFSGNMDTCITIRTIVIKNNIAYVQAGAGIVADSNPAKEYQESVNKAKALIEAITR
jgi:anthranilate synthase component 1